MAVLALSARPALAQDLKWQPHGEVVARPGSDRTSGELELFLPLWQDETSLIYGDLRGLGDSDGEVEGSAGVGYRALTGGGWILGGYVFGDIRETEHGNTFWQAGGGLEALSEVWDFRVNGYVPEEGAKVTERPRMMDMGDMRMRARTEFESAIGGGDGEIGVLLPGVLEETRAYVGGFYFEADKVGPEYGPTARVETRLHDLGFLGPGSRLTLGLEGEYDVVDDDPEGRGLLRLRIPFGAPAASVPLTPLERRMTDPVKRDIDVRVRGHAIEERLSLVNPKTDRGFDQFFYLEAGANGTGSQTDPTDFANGTAAGLFGNDDVLLVSGDLGPIPTNFRMNDGQYLLGGGTNLTLVGSQTGLVAGTIVSPGARPDLVDASGGTLPVLTGANDTQIQGVNVIGGFDGVVYRGVDDFMLVDTIIRDVRADETVAALGTGDGVVIDDSTNGMIMDVAVFNLMGPDADAFDIDDSAFILMEDIQVDEIWSTAPAVGLPAVADGDAFDIDNSMAITIERAEIANVHSTASATLAGGNWPVGPVAIADGDALDIDNSFAVTAHQVTIHDVVSGNITVFGDGDPGYKHFLGLADGDGADIDNSVQIAVTDATIDTIFSYDNDTVHRTDNGVAVARAALVDGDAFDVDQSAIVDLSGATVGTVISTAEAIATVAFSASGDATFEGTNGPGTTTNDVAFATAWAAARADGDAFDIDHSSHVNAGGATVGTVESTANALAEVSITANGAVQIVGTEIGVSDAMVNGFDVGVAGAKAKADGDGFDITWSSHVAADKATIGTVVSTADATANAEIDAGGQQIGAFGMGGQSSDAADVRAGVAKAKAVADGDGFKITHSLGVEAPGATIGSILSTANAAADVIFESAGSVTVFGTAAPFGNVAGMDVGTAAATARADGDGFEVAWSANVDASGAWIGPVVSSANAAAHGALFADSSVSAGGSGAPFTTADGLTFGAGWAEALADGDGFEIAHGAAIQAQNVSIGDVVSTANAAADVLALSNGLMAFDATAAGSASSTAFRSGVAQANATADGDGFEIAWSANVDASVASIGNVLSTADAAAHVLAHTPDMLRVTGAGFSDFGPTSDIVAVAAESKARADGDGFDIRWAVAVNAADAVIGHVVSSANAAADATLEAGSIEMFAAAQDGIVNDMRVGLARSKAAADGDGFEIAGSDHVGAGNAVIGNVVSTAGAETHVTTDAVGSLEVVSTADIGFNRPRGISNDFTVGAGWAKATADGDGFDVAWSGNVNAAGAAIGDVASQANAQAQTWISAGGGLDAAGAADVDAIANGFTLGAATAKAWADGDGFEIAGAWNVEAAGVTMGDVVSAANALAYTAITADGDLAVVVAGGDGAMANDVSFGAARATAWADGDGFEFVHADDVDAAGASIGNVVSTGNVDATVSLGVAGQFTAFGVTSPSAVVEGFELGTAEAKATADGDGFEIGWANNVNAHGGAMGDVTSTAKAAAAASLDVDGGLSIVVGAVEGPLENLAVEDLRLGVSQAKARADGDGFEIVGSHDVAADNVALGDVRSGAGAAADTVFEISGFIGKGDESLRLEGTGSNDVLVGTARAAAEADGDGFEIAGSGNVDAADAAMGEIVSTANAAAAVDIDALGSIEAQGAAGEGDGSANDISFGAVWAKALADGDGFGIVGSSDVDAAGATMGNVVSTAKAAADVAIATEDSLEIEGADGPGTTMTGFAFGVAGAKATAEGDGFEIVWADTVNAAGAAMGDVRSAADSTTHVTIDTRSGLGDGTMTVTGAQGTNAVVTGFEVGTARSKATADGDGFEIALANDVDAAGASMGDKVSQANALAHAAIAADGDIMATAADGDGTTANDFAFGTAKAKALADGDSFEIYKSANVDAAGASMGDVTSTANALADAVITVGGSLTATGADGDGATANDFAFGTAKAKAAADGDGFEIAWADTVNAAGADIGHVLSAAHANADAVIEARSVRIEGTDGAAAIANDVALGTAWSRALADGDGFESGWSGNVDAHETAIGDVVSTAWGTATADIFADGSLTVTAAFRDQAQSDGFDVDVAGAKASADGDGFEIVGSGAVDAGGATIGNLVSSAYGTATVEITGRGPRFTTTQGTDAQSDGAAFGVVDATAHADGDGFEIAWSSTVDAGNAAMGDVHSTANAMATVRVDAADSSISVTTSRGDNAVATESAFGVAKAKAAADGDGFEIAGSNGIGAHDAVIGAVTSRANAIAGVTFDIPRGITISSRLGATTDGFDLAVADAKTVADGDGFEIAWSEAVDAAGATIGDVVSTANAMAAVQANVSEAVLLQATIDPDGLVNDLDVGTARSRALADGDGFEITWSETVNAAGATMGDVVSTANAMAAARVNTPSSITLDAARDPDTVVNNFGFGTAKAKAAADGDGFEIAWSSTVDAAGATIGDVVSTANATAHVEITANGELTVTGADGTNAAANGFAFGVAKAKALADGDGVELTWAHNVEAADATIGNVASSANAAAHVSVTATGELDLTGLNGTNAITGGFDVGKAVGKAAADGDGFEVFGSDMVNAAGAAMGDVDSTANATAEVFLRSGFTTSIVGADFDQSQGVGGLVDGFRIGVAWSRALADGDGFEITGTNSIDASGVAIGNVISTAVAAAGVVVEANSGPLFVVAAEPNGAVVSDMALGVAKARALADGDGFEIVDSETVNASGAAVDDVVSMATANADVKVFSAFGPSIVGADAPRGSGGGSVSDGFQFGVSRSWAEADGDGLEFAKSTDVDADNSTIGDVRSAAGATATTQIFVDSAVTLIGADGPDTSANDFYVGLAKAMAAADGDGFEIVRANEVDAAGASMGDVISKANALAHVAILADGEITVTGAAGEDAIANEIAFGTARSKALADGDGFEIVWANDVDAVGATMGDVVSQANAEAQVEITANGELTATGAEGPGAIVNGFHVGTTKAKALADGDGFEIVWAETVDATGATMGDVRSMANALVHTAIVANGDLMATGTFEDDDIVNDFAFGTAAAKALADGDGFEIAWAWNVDATGATMGDVVSTANALAHTTIVANDALRIQGTGVGASGSTVNGFDTGVASAKAVADGDGFEIAGSTSVAAGNATIGTAASTADATANVRMHADGQIDARGLGGQFGLAEDVRMGTAMAKAVADGDGFEIAGSTSVAAGSAVVGPVASNATAAADVDIQTNAEFFATGLAGFALSGTGFEAGVARAKALADGDGFEVAWSANIGAAGASIGDLVSAANALADVSIVANGDAPIQGATGVDSAINDFEVGVAHAKALADGDGFEIAGSNHVAAGGATMGSVASSAKAAANVDIEANGSFSAIGTSGASVNATGFDVGVAHAKALADGDGFEIVLAGNVDAADATLGDVTSAANALAHVAIVANDTLTVIGAAGPGTLANGFDVGVAKAAAKADGDGFDIDTSMNVDAAGAINGDLASQANAVANVAVTAASITVIEEASAGTAIDFRFGNAMAKALADGDGFDLDASMNVDASEATLGNVFSTTDALAVSNAGGAMANTLADGDGFDIDTSMNVDMTNATIGDVVSVDDTAIAYQLANMTMTATARADGDGVDIDGSQNVWASGITMGNILSTADAAAAVVVNVDGDLTVTGADGDDTVANDFVFGAATAWALADGDGFDIDASTQIDAAGATIGDVVSTADAAADARLEASGSVALRGADGTNAVVNGLDVGTARAAAKADGDGFDITWSNHVEAAGATLGDVLSTADATATAAVSAGPGFTVVGAAEPNAVARDVALGAAWAKALADGDGFEIAWSQAVDATGAQIGTVASTADAAANATIDGGTLFRMEGTGADTTGGLVDGLRVATATAKAIVDGDGFEIAGSDNVEAGGTTMDDVVSTANAQADVMVAVNGDLMVTGAASPDQVANGVALGVATAKAVADGDGFAIYWANDVAAGGATLGEVVSTANAAAAAMVDANGSLTAIGALDTNGVVDGFALGTARAKALADGDGFEIAWSANVDGGGATFGNLISTAGATADARVDANAISLVAAGEEVPSGAAGLAVTEVALGAAKAAAKADGDGFAIAGSNDVGAGNAVVGDVASTADAVANAAVGSASTLFTFAATVNAEVQGVDLGVARFKARADGDGFEIADSHTVDAGNAAIGDVRSTARGTGTADVEAGGEIRAAGALGIPDGTVSDVAYATAKGAATADGDGFEITDSMNVGAAGATIGEVVSKANAAAEVAVTGGGDATAAGAFLTTGGSVEGYRFGTATAKAAADGDGFEITDSMNVDAAGATIGDVDSTANAMADVTMNVAGAFTAVGVSGSDTVVNDAAIGIAKAKALADGDGFDITWSNHVDATGATIGDLASQANAVANVTVTAASISVTEEAGGGTAIDFRFGNAMAKATADGDGFDLDMSNWIEAGGATVEFVTSWANAAATSDAGALSAATANALADGDGFDLDMANHVDATMASVQNVMSTATAVATAIGASSVATANAAAEGDGFDLDQSAFVDLNDAFAKSIFGNALATATATTATPGTIVDPDGLDIDDSMDVTMAGFTFMNIQDDGVDIDPSQNILVDGGLIMNVGGHGVAVADDGTDNVFIFNTTIDGTGGDGINVAAPLNYDAMMPFDFANAEVFIDNLSFNAIGGMNIAGSNIDL